MKKMKQLLKWISPFNHMEEMPTSIYIVKKLLAFLFLYFCSGILGEAVIITGLTIAGYDPLHGDMPAGEIATLIQYFGYSIYLMVTIFYWKKIEKSTIKSLGFHHKVTDYFLGIAWAVSLLVAIIAIMLFSGDIVFTGINENANYGYMVALLLGMMIQGAAEEALCRGFLQTVLMKKVPVFVAILISATAFAYPHFSTLFEAETEYTMTGVVNLFLISIIFSMLTIQRRNIWVACGLHSIWNFLLYGVFGLTLSGNEASETGMFCFEIRKCSIINGGEYGLEAGMVTALVLMLVAALLIWKWRKKDGVQ